MIKPRPAPGEMSYDEQIAEEERQRVMLFQKEEVKLMALQALRKSEGWNLMLMWFDSNVDRLILDLKTETDPTKLARATGALAAFDDVRSRVDVEIQAAIEYLRTEVVKK